MHKTTASLVRAIDAILPQTQCTRCGYEACLPYANAIASEGAPINRCPPGGVAVLHSLAALLDRPVVALDSSCGEFTPQRVAYIDEAQCIGCTLCIGACPVDAIIGGPKKMHVVIDEHCTGCELCVLPCPVDCITMEPARSAEWTGAHAHHARLRYEAHEARRAISQTRAEANTSGLSSAPSSQEQSVADTRRANLAAALARGRAKRRFNQAANTWRQ